VPGSLENHSDQKILEDARGRAQRVAEALENDARDLREHPSGGGYVEGAAIHERAAGEIRRLIATLDAGHGSADNPPRTSGNDERLTR
jgi:hypothetical protein